MSPKAQRSQRATRSPSSSSAARRAALVALIVLAGCGHSPRPPHVSAKPAGPAGHLTRSEYRAIEREYARLRPLEHASDLTRAAARAKGACARLGKPSSRLVALVRVDCLHAIRFFTALGGIQTAADHCRADKCLAQRYQELADALLAITSGASGLNQELARRHITGLCALSIGIRPRDLAALHAAALAATGAADAIRAGEAAVYEHYSKALDSAFAAQDPHDALTGIRAACNPDRGARRPRKVPKANPPHVPRAKPHPHRAKPKRHRRAMPKPIAPGSGLNI